VLGALATTYRLVDLAGEQDVPKTGGDRRRELHHSERLEGADGGAELEVRREVLPQRCLGIDVQGRQGPAAVASSCGRLPRTGQLDLGVAERCHVEEAGDALPSLDLAQEHVLALLGQRYRQGGGHGRLPGPAFAADDVEPDRLLGGGHACKGTRSARCG